MATIIPWCEYCTIGIGDTFVFGKCTLQYLKVRGHHSLKSQIVQKKISECIYRANTHHTYSQLHSYDNWEWHSAADFKSCQLVWCVCVCVCVCTERKWDNREKIRKIRMHKFSSLVLLWQDCFAYSGFLVFPYEF